VAPRIELLDDRLRIDYLGLEQLLVLRDKIDVRYDHIRAVEVGLDRVPSPWALRLGLSVPWSDRRAGWFWSEGRKLFLDVKDRQRAVVLRLREAAPFDAVAIQVERPDELADALRERARGSAP
jgi:hypothetical protein